MVYCQGKYYPADGFCDSVVHGSKMELTERLERILPCQDETYLVDGSLPRWSFVCQDVGALVRRRKLESSPCQRIFCYAVTSFYPCTCWLRSNSLLILMMPIMKKVRSNCWHDGCESMGISICVRSRVPMVLILKDLTKITINNDSSQWWNRTRLEAENALL
jgi:hypothetical protein